MVRVAGIYQWKEGARFNHQYYTTRHMELTYRLLTPFGLIRLESDRAVINDSAEEGEIIATSHAYFDTVEQAHAALAATGDELMADVSNYTTLQPQVYIGVVTSHT